MNTSRIMRAASEIEKNAAALKWLEEYGSQYTGCDKGEASVEVRLHLASSCHGAKEAQEIVSSFARISLPDLIKTATQNCRNTIAACEEVIREEAATQDAGAAP